MNSKKMIKIVLVFMLGIITFLINSDKVYADTVCKYDGAWGTIEFYPTHYDRIDAGVKYKFTKAPDCGGTVDNACAKVKMESTSGKVLSPAYVFNYNKDNGSYTCPVLYYTYKIDGYSNWSGKFNKTFTFSPDPTKYDNAVTSSVGVVDVNYTNCNDALEKLSTLKKAVSDFRASVGAAQSAMIFTDNYNIIQSYDRWKSAQSGVEKNHSSVTAAYSAYSEAAKKTSAAACSGFEDPEIYSKQINSLWDSYKSFGNDAKTAYEKAIAATKDEEEKKKLEEQLEDIEKTNKENQERANEFKQAVSENGDVGYDTNAIDCDELLGPDVLKDINKILTWIKVAVPILLIVLGSLDFGKAVLADDQKALSKATSNFVKRIIAAIAVFFVPFLIMYLLKFVDEVTKTCDVKSIYEGVIMWKI